MTSPDGVLASVIFCLIALPFAALVWRTRPAATTGGLFPLFLLARSAMPVVMMAACFLLAEASPLTDTVRAQIKALYVNAADPDGLRVGGGGDPAVAPVPGTDPDLLVNTQDRGEPASGYFDIVRVGPTPGSTATDRVVLTTRATDRSITLVQYAAFPPPAWFWFGTRDRPAHWVGAVAITRGTDLCLARCADRNAHFHLVNGQLRSPVKTIDLPVRSGLAGWMRPWPPTAAVYLMRDLVEGIVPPDQAQGLRSILLEDTGTWFVVPLDPGAQITPAPGCTIGGSPVRQVDLALPGDCAAARETAPLAGREQGAIAVHIGLIGLTDQADDPKPEGIGGRLQLLINGGTAHRRGLAPWREQRSFTLARAGSDEHAMVRLALDRPETMALGAFSWPRARLALHRGQGTDEPDVIDLHWLRGGTRTNSVLSQAALHFPEAMNAWRSPTGARRGEARSPACNGVRPDLCAGDAGHAMAVDVDRLSVPWTLLIIAGFSATIVHVLSRRWWMVDRVDGLGIAGIQFLLAMRAVIAFEGALIDTALNPSALYVESAVDLVALPTLLMALRPLRALPLRETLALMLFNLAVFGCAWQRYHKFGVIEWVFAGAAVVALSLRLIVTAVRARKQQDHQQQDQPARRRQSLPHWLHVPTCALVALVLVRGALPLIGFREHIGMLQISAIYAPAMVLALGAWLAWVEGDQTRRGLWICFAYPVLVGAVLGVTYLSHDAGFVMVFAVPLLGVGLWRARAWMEQGARFRAVWPLVVVLPLGAVAYCLALALAPIVLRPPAIDQGSGIAAIGDRLAYANTYNDGNYMRLVAALAPQYVAEIGTKSANLQMEQTIQLSQRTTLFGRGYGLPSNLPTSHVGQQLGILHDVHLSDNVSAVHLMGPFGRLGAVAFLTVLIAISAGMCSARPETGWQRPLAMAGALAIWVVFGAAVYMILGNLLLVPFTGRNIYLLAANSGGDLLEGLLLFGIAIVGLGHTPRT